MLWSAKEAKGPRQAADFRVRGGVIVTVKSSVSGLRHLVLDLLQTLTRRLISTIANVAHGYVNTLSSIC